MAGPALLNFAFGELLFRSDYLCISQQELVLILLGCLNLNKINNFTKYQADLLIVVACLVYPESLIFINSNFCYCFISCFIY